jgi:drug/metabolite transporter (DMT)-like permease
MIWNSSSVFVFILSIFMLGEQASVIKLISVVITLGGVVLISILGESNTPNISDKPNKIMGIVLSLGMLD